MLLGVRQCDGRLQDLNSASLRASVEFRIGKYVTAVAPEANAKLRRRQALPSG
jgi:hypothetical protein